MKFKNIEQCVTLNLIQIQRGFVKWKIDQKKFSRSKENTKYWKIFYDGL